MIQCKVYGKKWNIYNCSNFPYDKLYEDNKSNYISKGRGKKSRYKIYNMICSFDTESTTINDTKDYSFLAKYREKYVWQ